MEEILIKFYDFIGGLMMGCFISSSMLSWLSIWIYKWALAMNKLQWGENLDK